MSVRVLMIAFTNYPGDTRVRREAEALVARGDVVDVICPLTDAIGDRRTIGGVRLHPTGTLRQEGELSPIAYICRDVAFVVRAMFKARRLHRINQYDVVHVHTMPDYLVAAALFPKLAKAKVLLDVHDLVPELYTAKFGVKESSTVIRLTKLVERRCIGFADHALAVHQPHRTALVEHGNPEEAFTIVMNAPDPRFFTRRSTTQMPEEQFVLLYHGTISRRHGLDDAIRALDIARRTYEDLRLEVVGDGDDVDRLFSIVERLDLADAVHIQRGLLPIEELKPVLDRATVGIVPIVDNSFTRYMLPVKLLEYIALGIPVICSRTSSIEAYFDDTMVSFFRPGDEHDLAARIVELRSDEERRRSLVEHADVFLRQHSWSRERDRYYSVIDNLVEQGRGDVSASQDAVGSRRTERALG